MRIIEDFDLNNYDTCKGLFQRIAIRAIIINHDQIACIKSSAYQEYKFPGGGKEDGERDIDTLVRETMEETGLSILVDTVLPYGMTIEKRRSILNPDDLFIMESYYYTCRVSHDVNKTNLDAYEDAYGYKLAFVNINEAIQSNEHASRLHQDHAPWIDRELAVMKDIKEKFGL